MKTTLRFLNVGAWASELPAIFPAGEVVIEHGTNDNPVDMAFEQFKIRAYPKYTADNPGGYSRDGFYACIMEYTTSHGCNILVLVTTQE